MLADLLFLIGGGILAVSMFPQIIKILKTKSVKDLSSLYFSGVLIGIALIEVAAILISQTAYVISNGLGLIFIITIIVQIIYYRYFKKSDLENTN